MIFTYKHLCYSNVNFCDINPFPVICYIFILVQSFTLLVGKIALMANIWYVKIECRL